MKGIPEELSVVSKQATSDLRDFFQDKCPERGDEVLAFVSTVAWDALYMLMAMFPVGERQQIAARMAAGVIREVYREHGSLSVGERLSLES